MQKVDLCDRAGSTDTDTAVALEGREDAYQNKVGSWSILHLCSVRPMTWNNRLFLILVVSETRYVESLDVGGIGCFLTFQHFMNKEMINKDNFRCL